VRTLHFGVVRVVLGEDRYSKTNWAPDQWRIEGKGRRSTNETAACFPPRSVAGVCPREWWPGSEGIRRPRGTFPLWLHTSARPWVSRQEKGMGPFGDRLLSYIPLGP